MFSAVDGQSIDDLIPDVLRYKVAGIIITSSSLSGRAAELCEGADVPVVLFHRYSDRGNAFAVACDSRAGGVAAALMLIEAGCRRLGYLGGNPNSSPNRDRREGFLTALSEAGIAPATVAQYSFTYEWGWRGAARLLSEAPDLDGIFCGDDAIACGAVDALRHDLGRRVPEDISIVGFDDVPQAGWAAYQLTTIRQPLSEMIERTLALLDDPDGHERRLHTVPGVIIRRATVRS